VKPAIAAAALGPRERLLAALLLALPALYFAYAWLGYRDAWLHPELLGTSEYVWNFPGTEGPVSQAARPLWCSSLPHSRLAPHPSLT